MKLLRRLILLAATLLFIGTSAYGQRFLWELDMDYQFDNREYDKMDIVESGTYYGARLSPRIGLGWSESSAIMIGVDLLADFGRDGLYRPDVTFYYRYTDSRYSVYAGRFPRQSLRGEYSRAFFSDYVRFYDNNLDGLLASYKGRSGYVEFACDWNSMQGDDVREKFMLFSSGQINYRFLFAGYNLSMYHHAGSINERGVVDNLLIYPYIGADFREMTCFDQLSLKIGMLQAFQNDRRYIGTFVTPGGPQIEAKAEYYGFGIYNTIYFGDSLMPYYEGTVEGQPDYGASLYYGEPFYRTTSGMYNRLEIYWQHRFKSDVNFKVASIHHCDGRNWVWQQMLSIQVKLSDKMFGKRK